MTTRLRIRVAATNSDPNSSCCCVASFPGGLPTSLRSGQNNKPGGGANKLDVPRLAVRVATPTTTTTKKNGKKSAAPGDTAAMTVVGKDSTCYYAGTVVNPSASRMCVGVYDKQTSTLTLYPAATTNLQQSVIGYKPKAAVSAATHEGDSTPAQNSNSAGVTKKVLLEEFGSVKKQRVYKSQEVNQVHLENVVGSTVEQFLDRSGGGRKTNPTDGPNDDPAADGAPLDPLERAMWEWRHSFLPPFDKDATDPLRIYRIDDFAGRDVWRLLGRRAHSMLKDTDRVRRATATAEPSSFGKNDSNDNTESYLPSALSSLKRLVLQQEGDGSANLYQVKCVLLYHYLATLYLQLHKRQFIPAVNPNRDVFFGAPVEVGHLFLDQFATSIHSNGKPGYVMSTANHDKCRIHLLLLHVVSHNDVSQVPIADASGDLRLDIKNAIHLLRLAGCVIDRKRGAADPRATLSVPLTFPPATGKRKRGGGGRR